MSRRASASSAKSSVWRLYDSSAAFSDASMAVMTLLLAAEDAGLGALRLLEEPQAAIYAWIAANEDWRARLEGVRHVLVVDVGGGTTDFSLFAVKPGGFGDADTWLRAAAALGVAAGA